MTARDEEKKTATMRFQANALPSVGFKIFTVKAGDGTVETNLSVEENDSLFVMENEFLKVEIDKETGNIAQVYNKKDNNRPVFADGYQATRSTFIRIPAAVPIPHGPGHG